MNRHCLFAILAILFAAIGTSNLYAQIDEEKVSGFETTFTSMGTLVSLQSFSNDPKLVEDAFAKTRSEIDRLVKIFSDYDEESEARKLTVEEKINSAECKNILEFSDEFASGGVKFL